MLMSYHAGLVPPIDVSMCKTVSSGMVDVVMVPSATLTEETASGAESTDVAPALTFSVKVSETPLADRAVADTPINFIFAGTWMLATELALAVCSPDKKTGSMLTGTPE